jgi:hypothetical protein
MATALQYYRLQYGCPRRCGCGLVGWIRGIKGYRVSYANLSFLFARFHAKIYPGATKTADFVASGFQGSDEDEDEDDHEE